MLMAPLSSLGYQIQTDITPNVTFRYFFDIEIVMRVTEKMEFPTQEALDNYITVCLLGHSTPIHPKLVALMSPILMKI